MSCEAYGLLISKWVDGEAKPEEVRRVEAHVSSCGVCRKLADEFRRNAGLIDAAFGPESFGQQVAGRVHRSIALRQGLMRWIPRVAVAAAFLTAFLVVRADRAAERRAFNENMQSALRTLEALKPAPIVVAAPAEPRRVVELVILPAPGAGPVITPERAPEHVAQGDPPRRDIHPGTFAMDRVDATSDYASGAVALTWRMERAPNCYYFVHRRVEGEESFGPPLNDSPLTDSAFKDASARALTTYEYCVVALNPVDPVAPLTVSDEIARVTTHADLELKYNGRGTLDLEGRRQTVAWFTVRIRDNGTWVDETFSVTPGGVIGEVTSRGDLRTRFEFVSQDMVRVANKEYSLLRATLRTPAGVIHLWNGQSAIGSRERLFLEDHPQ